MPRLCQWNEHDILSSNAPHHHAKVFMHKPQLSKGTQCVELLQTLIAKISHKVMDGLFCLDYFSCL